MGDLAALQLKPDAHVALDQPLMRLPFELSRNTFRTAHRHVEQSQLKIDELLKTALKNAASPAADGSGSSSGSLAALDQAIARLRTLKRKLSSLQDAQETYSAQSAARIEHLDALYGIQTTADVKYETWSKTRLNRLLVDYLVRKGHIESARALAADTDIGKLVDIEEFDSIIKIAKSLQVDRRVDLALTWCGENKQTLKKMESTFEFDLRMQQYVELIRTRQADKVMEAILHARKYLNGTANKAQCIEVAGLLAFEPDTDVEPFSDYFASHRWSTLAAKFLETHHKIYSLPLQPMLHIALTAGLSALKTPACHSKFVSPTSGLHVAGSPSPLAFIFSDEAETDTNMEDSRTSRSHPMELSIDSILEPSQSTTLLDTPVCPICSTELNKLARGVPFAHHSKSNVESDPVVLPNGRVYGRERLLALNEKLGTRKGYVVDPLEPEEVIPWARVRKIFIS